MQPFTRSAGYRSPECSKEPEPPSARQPEPRGLRQPRGAAAGPCRPRLSHKGALFLLPCPLGRGFRPQLPLGSDDAHLPAGRGAPESARFFARGKRGHDRWGGRKGAWTVKAVQERSRPSWSQAHPAWAFVVRRMSQGSPRGGTSRSLDPSIHTHVKRFITGPWPAW